LSKSKTNTFNTVNTNDRSRSVNKLNNQRRSSYSPPNFRRRHAGHDSPLSGHLSTNKTYKTFLGNFWWKSMKKDIKKYISCCDKCLRKNKIHARHIAPIQKFEKIRMPFHNIAMDIMSTSKNRFALVVIDLATRWIEVVPLKEITTERICNALLSIFTRFGFPSVILSDNGTQFVSHLTNAFTKMLEITQVFAARYHPQANGCVERANQTIKLMLLSMFR
jgi:IS30 family transposase